MFKRSQISGPGNYENGIYHTITKIFEKLHINIQKTPLTSFGHIGATFVVRKPLRILVYSYRDIQKVMAWISWV